MHDANRCCAGLGAMQDPGFLGVLRGWSVHVTECVLGASAPKCLKMELSGECVHVRQASTQMGVVVSMTDGKGEPCE